MEKNKKSLIFSVVVLFAMAFLFFMPTGFEQADDPTYEKVRAEVVTVDNSQLEQMGFVKVGSQGLTIKILNGKFKDQVVEAPNLLSGKMEMDKIFQPGDQVLAVLSFDYDTILNARALDHYRLHLEWMLVAAFTVLLIGFAGFTGVQALISFAFTLLMIWKVLIPSFLKGYSPLPVSVGIVITLCFVIIFLVAGINRKGLVAFLGAAAGVVTTCLLAIGFGAAFKIHGAVVPYAESLLHTGFAELDLTGIFLSGIYLASSGAIMDIAMDLSASMYELRQNNPNISKKALLRSGFNIGRAVIGTMTTTLLLAYTGGFTALLMLFMAQGIPLINIVNYNFIAAEILHTMVGSFGLVLTAPLTAVIGSVLLSKGDQKEIRTGSEAVSEVQAVS